MENQDYWSDVNVVGNCYIRRDNVYMMKFTRHVPDLNKYLTAMAPYAGPLAVFRKNDFSEESKIEIFNAVGQLITEFKWTSGNLLRISWSSTECLICVQTDGAVLAYQLRGGPAQVHRFYLDDKSGEQVASARFYESQFGTGIAIATTNGRFFFLHCLEKFSPKPLVGHANPSPSAWCVMAPRPVAGDFSPDQIRVLAIHKGSLLLMEQNRRTVTLLDASSGPEWHDLCLSLDQTLLAVWSQQQYQLTIYSLVGLLGSGGGGQLTTLSRHNLSEGGSSLPSLAQGPPLRMGWCSNSAVLLVWPDSRCLLPASKSDRFSNRLDDFHEGEGGPPLLVPEFDGLRLVTSERHELLRPLPLSVELLFNIASVSPAAMLLLAHGTISGHSRTETAAYELFLTIDSDADKLAAVKCCLEAARFIACPFDQKRVLRAARTGLALLPPQYSREHRTNELCQQLRLLNNLRLDESIGLPLTHAQLSRLGLPVLLDRLLNRLLHQFAFRACEMLRLPESEGQSRVMMHWAECQIDTMPPVTEANGENNQANEALVSNIANFVGQRIGVNYARLAGKAAKMRRPNLAMRLLDFEMRSLDQVEQLVALGKYAKALEKAVQSGDTDLIHQVLLKLHKMRDELDLNSIMRRQPEAMSLYQESYCNNSTTMLEQDDRRVELAAYELRRAFDTSEAGERQKLLNAAATKFTEAGMPVAARECQLSVALLEKQRKLDKDLSTEHYCGLTLHATLSRLLANGSEKLAESLRREFEVPDKRWWQLQVTALAKSSRFAELRRLAERKSPIGYAPFVNACLDASNEAEAALLLPKVEREQRVRCLFCLRRYTEAIELASSMKQDAAYHLEYLRRNLTREDARQRDQVAVKEAMQRLRQLHQSMTAGGVL